MEEINSLNKRNKPFRLIENIKHIIENIEKEDMYRVEKNKLNSTSKIEVLKQFL